MGWFYGFKCHLMINDQGELLSAHITSGNIDDRKPAPRMAKKIHGKLFGDKRYISNKLAMTLREPGIHLVTSVRATMKNKFMPYIDKTLTSKMIDN